MVVTDLTKRLPDCEITFIKVSSYDGTAFTGKFIMRMPLLSDVKDKNVVIMEDIIDTGNTINYLYPIIASHKPKSISICSMFMKDKVFEDNGSKLTYLPEDMSIYVGKKIENVFVIGRGLDFNGLGRTYEDLYRLDSE